ncbi:MAG: type IV pilus biogenesis/stability protein PilW [Rhodocyclaceae bacterium]|nr:type IV pilus biogenesis/stability protein PilW [Rhodocyclaceae bacterium]MBR4737251.1 type IV pilus biogenesis/stability protein PilW [Rhodocyclaceae bacterium]
MNPSQIQHIPLRTLCAAALSAVLLGACATTGSGAGGGGYGGSAVRPVADQEPKNSAQARAKNNVDLGMAYMSLGNFGVALDEARNAVKHDSSYAPAYHLMGLVYMYIDDLNASRENFQRARSLAPGDPDIENSYGWFQCVSGNTSAGLETLRRVVKNPYFRYPGRAYTNMGLCYLRDKDDQQAEAMFAHALQVDPKNPQAMFQLADIAFRRGDLNHARKYLDQFHSSNEPDPATAWLGLRIARAMNDTDAQEHYGGLLRENFRQSKEYREMMQQ